MASVFGADVDALLTTASLSGAADVNVAAARKFTTGGMARMVGLSVDDQPTFTPDNGADVSEKYLEAAIGALLERQATFGPLLHYPRTFVVGPRGGFGCNRGRGVQASEWQKDVTGPKKTSTLYARDLDRLVWVNHCHKAAGVRTTQSEPTVSINMATFDQAHRNDNTIVVHLFRYTLRGGAVKGGFTQAGTEVVKEFHTLADNLGLHDVTPGRTYTYSVRPLTDMVLQVDTTEGEFTYVKQAVVILERFMRGENLSDDKQIDVVDAVFRDSILYNAVLAGVIPYGRDDLVNAQTTDPSTRVPAPMPGEATNERLINVMDKLLGYNRVNVSPSTVGASVSPYAALFTGTSTPTPAVDSHVIAASLWTYDDMPDV